MEAINATARKFQHQLQRLIEATASDPNSVALLKERCAKAIEYFTAQIATQLVAPLREHIGTLGHKKKMKRYAHHLQRVEESCWSKIERLYGARFLDERLYTGEALHIRSKSTPTATAERRQERGNTQQDTLDLHRKGKSADEIAEIRGLTVGTIKSHLGD
jgi:DNA-binding NarL/FixJ family response regulator